MSDDLILAKLKEIISNQLGIGEDKVVPTADFTKELGADSLDVVELVMAFEEQFEIEIDDDQAGELSTVQDALDYIKANQPS
uniref:acyl carrier protein n=1 Tax=Hemiaulus sinensis TaxID=1003062 RepID=UPI002238D24C|nr:acyl carrier protein [Hemiaulus sinensis]YP_010537265.1 acyl carrier protein [Hemiaulus sinensis]UYC30992.1 acyl carrier protein [Hemiaulus sinensis]UYC31052.1 acyl carrier protein [Hemiaulus sinensis]